MCGLARDYFWPTPTVDRVLASARRLTQRPDSLQRWCPKFLLPKRFGQICLTSSPVRLTRCAWPTLYHSLLSAKADWGMTASLRAIVLSFPPAYLYCFPSITPDRLESERIFNGGTD